MAKRFSGMPSLDPPVRWHEWAKLRVGLLWIYDAPVAVANRRGRYTPQHLGAWLLKKGRATLRQEGKTVVAHAGEWLVPWPGYRYQEFSDDAEIISVRFRADWPDGKPLFDRGLSVKFPAREHPELARRAHTLLDAARPVIPANPTQLAQAPVAFDDFIEVHRAFMSWLGVFYATLCGLGVKPSRIGIHDERIVAALHTLDSVALSERLLESRLAGEAGLGVSQFVRLFRHELGETPKQYFDQRRRAYCREMIAGTPVPIKEVAYTLGFKRLSDFSAWFKAAHGMSPRRFREEVRQSTHV